jgi:hypothetical protein
VELCDCFIDYGAATAEMALLFTFVLFGASLIWSGFTVISWATAAFAVVVLLVRPPIFMLSLARSGVDRRDRLLIAWFGPRGLSSLLLVLLPVFAGLPGSEQLFAVCCLVVLLSVIVHGGAPMLLNFSTPHQTAAPSLQVSSAAVPPPAMPTPTVAAQAGDGHLTAAPLMATSTRDTSAPIDGDASTAVEAHSLSVDRLRQLWQAGAPVLILDVRTERAYDPSPQQAHAAVRMPPDHVVERAHELNLPRDAWIVAYCA